MLIKGEKTYLEAFSEQDSLIIHDWMNQFELRRLAWTECHWPVTPEEARRFIQSLNSHEQSRLLALHESAFGRIIGFFTVRNISWVSRSLRFGCLIWPPKYWSQGLGTDARKAFLDYAFNYLGFQRVYGYFADYNTASRRSHEKLGARVTVTNREAIFMDGRYHNEHYYVYCREILTGSQPESLIIKDDDFSVEDLRRTYGDFYEVPASEEKFRAWLSHQLQFHQEDGDSVFLIDQVKRSADLLFFPVAPENFAALIETAVAKAFKTYNLHRIQVCLPSSATQWRNLLIQKGFSDEGRLPAIVYSNGSYHDLCFYGFIN